MSSVIKIIVVGLSAVFILVTALCSPLTSMDVVNSSYYFESVTAVIVESNYNENVIAQCVQEASENGYTLEVTVYGGTIPGEQKYAEFNLTYDFEVPLIKLKLPKVRQKVM